MISNHYCLIALEACVAALSLFLLTCVAVEWLGFRRLSLLNRALLLLAFGVSCLWGGGKSVTDAGMAPNLGLRLRCGDSTESVTNELDEAFSDGRFFRIDSFLKGSNRIDVGVSWSPLFFATGSVVNLYGRAGALTNESELIATGEIASLTQTNLFLSAETPLAETNAAFFRMSSPCDADDDGLPDWFELGEFGSDPNKVDTDGDGFPDSSEYALELDPLGTEVSRINEYWTGVTGYRLTEPFSTESTNDLRGPVFVRTLNLSRRSTFTQFFVSTDPTWLTSVNGDGFEVSYYDDAGHTGKVAAAELTSGLRLSQLPPSFDSITIELVATSNELYCTSDLHLVSYRPGIVLDAAQTIGPARALRAGPNLLSAQQPEILVVIGLTTGVSFDYWGRPSSEPISAEEEMANPFEGIQGLTYSPVDHVLTAEHPGTYAMPDGRTLIFLTPSISYGHGHSFTGTRIYYNPVDGSYGEEPPYPLDTACLYEGWYEGQTNPLGCSCVPEVRSGLEDYGNDSRVLAWYSLGDDEATGYVEVNGCQVWQDTATHSRYATYGGASDVLSGDPCASCSSGCKDGNCDALEGPSLGSVRFRIPLGNSEADHVSGFLYFDRDNPFVVRTGDFKLLIRPDSWVNDEMSAEGVRMVFCGDNRGRTVMLTDTVDGVEIDIFDASGEYEHCWQISTSGDAMRFRKISRLDNVMMDKSYVFLGGTWAEVDNTSGLETVMSLTGSLGSPDGRTEERIIRDGGTVVSHTQVRSTLIGSGEGAVVREVERRELVAGGAWRVSHAAYWNDPAHPRRHGTLKLEWGDDRNWRYCAYDEEGRETFRLDQRNGSPAVDADGDWSLENLPAVDAFATVSAYVPLPGDGNDERDSDKVRTESRYVVRGGTATLIGRTWYKHERIAESVPFVRTTTIRAHSPHSRWFDRRNAVSEETRYESDSPYVPYLLRGELRSRTESDGVVTRWDSWYDYNGGIRTEERRCLNGVEADTYKVTVRDETYGNLVYEATALTADDTEFGWKSHTYDEKNRLILTQYDDGSFETNAYSCCRLLWTIDRNGAKTLRSATTGTDHLYYAEEEVYIADLPNDAEFCPETWNYSHYTNAFRVTKHFFDALGRETNTTQCSSFHPGYSVDPSHKWNNHGIDASATTVYPDGVSDYSIARDVGGLVTESFSATTGEGEWHEQTLWDSDYSADDPVRLTVSASYRGGGSVERTEHDGVWREVSRYDDYGSDGLRSGYEIAEDSDGNRVTNRIDRYDFLGRLVASVTPLSVVSNVYDGASDRAVASVDLVSGRATTNLYDEVGESVGSLSDEIEQRSETSYELDGGELWRVELDFVSSGSVTASCSTVRTRLTGLSDALRAETVRETDGVVVETTRSAFDPATSVLTETVTSATDGERTVRSMYGREIETVGREGRIFYYYDPYGRIYFSRRSARDGSHFDYYREWFRDAADRLVYWGERNSYTSWSVLENNFDFDARGNEARSADALGNEVFRAYDGADNLTGVYGDTYELRYGYDAVGRRKALETTRDGEAFDRTSWEYDPQTGLCLAKEYADGSRVEYSYTADGLPLRTDLPNGHWNGCRYDSLRRKIADESDDASCTAVYAYDVFGRLVSAESSAASYAYSLNGRGTVTNETATVGGVSREIRRTVDPHGRQVGLTADGCADTTYDYSVDGLLYAISNDDAAVEYRYDYLSADVGCDLTLANGVRFERILTRQPRFHEEVLSVVNRAPLSTNSLAYTYDKLHRPTVRNADRFAYNRRGEVSSATVAGELSAYAYDGIGNFTTVTGGTVTNVYAANELNQYEMVTSDCGTVEPTYTSNGELASFGPWTYAYDALSRLTAAYSNGTLVVSNRYDHLGRRVQKIAMDGTHTFLYDGWRPVVETVAKPSGGTDRIEYYWGKDLSGTLDSAAGVGGLLYVKRNGATYVPFYDAFGNIMGYWDENGNVVAEYVYDAFGRTVAQVGPMADVFTIRYSTKYYDAETGMYYYGKRFYVATLCRWLTRDPIEEQGGVNLYGFCENNLVCNIDACGLTKYWDNYMRYGTYDAQDVWEKVGGGLYWEHLSHDDEDAYWNSCALRVSRAIVQSGDIVNAGDGRNKNNDFMATRNVTRGRKSAKKGEVLKAEKAGARYVISARKIPELLDEIITKDKLKKKVEWKTAAEGKALSREIQQCDDEAFFVGSSPWWHAGMIKKGYEEDEHFFELTKGTAWILKSK